MIRLLKLRVARLLAGLMLALTLPVGTSRAEALAAMKTDIARPYQEKYRPQFHMSPQSGWMGDPCGLIYDRGLYHLFWWGHAVSRDLVHWTELPWPMLGGDGSFAYFTGSMVRDMGNTSGLGAGALVAVYTMHRHRDSLETVGLSSSQNGIDFRFFPGNPVLDIGSASFRDPQVLWHGPTKRWVMVITRPDQHKVGFYSSPDLKSWKHESDFGPLGAREGLWEVPDLFQLPVHGQPGVFRWVLTVCVGPNKVQYFTGSFDGASFTPDEATEAFLKRGLGLEGEVFASFDNGTFDGWAATGAAFGQAPAQGASVKYLGAGYADSIGGSDSAVGTLSSPLFTIEKPCINFLLAGGRHPGQACVNLLVDGQVVRTSTGDNTGVLKWSGWNVSDLEGRRAQIQIVDSYAGADFGHVMADHFLFSDSLQSAGWEHALWADRGSDFYAAHSWHHTDSSSDSPPARTSWLGWMDNWEYAREVPTSYGKGFQSIPRDLELRSFHPSAPLQLIQKPIEALKSLRGQPIAVDKRALKQGAEPLDEFKPWRNSYEIEAEFDTRQSSVLGFNLLVGAGRKLVLGYNARTRSLFVDRTQTTDFTSDAAFNAAFPRRFEAPVENLGGRLKLRVFVDRSCVEVFAGHGEAVFSVLTFPGEDQTGVEVFSEGGGSLSSFKAWELKSIWATDEPSRIPGTIEGTSFRSRSASRRQDERGAVSVERGEWVSCAIKADWPGAYDLGVRAAGKGTLHLELDGRDVTGPLQVLAPADSPAWMVAPRRVGIPFGEHALRLVVDRGSLRLSGLRLATGSRIVPGGTYRIAGRLTGRLLEAVGTGDGAAVQQWETRAGQNHENQTWNIQASGAGLYTLTLLGSGQALSVRGSENGTPLELRSPTGAASQRWSIRDIGGGYFAIVSASNGKVLDVRDNSAQNGGLIHQWDALGGVNQGWRLELVSPEPK